MAPRSLAIGNADAAFDGQGGLVDNRRRGSVQAVIDQVLFAAQRLAA